MRLTSISITDLAGFSGTVNFPLHAVSIIEGNHGTGKSSLLDVLSYAFGRRPLSEPGSRSVDHDAAMINGSKERGEAVITFDDSSSLRVLVTADSTTRQIKSPGAKKWDRATPQFIDSLVNALSYDPFSLKALTEKQRIEALLLASPVTVSIEEITAAVGDAIPVGNVRPDIETIDQLSSHIYDLRRTRNVAADTQRKHAQQLREALPPSSQDDIDWQKQADDKRNEREALTLSLATVKKTIGDIFRGHEAEQKDNHAKTTEKAKAAYDEGVAALRETYNATVEKSLKTCNEEIESARAMANQTVRDKQTEIQPQYDALTTEIATAEERALATAKVTGTRAAVDAADKEAAQHQSESDKMTGAIERLATLKSTVAGRLKITNITIAAPKEGQPIDICREEKGSLVPFSRWNEADKDMFCMRMAVLMHGACGVVFVDEIGHLTEERKASLMKTAKKYAVEGMQFIFSQAAETELTVREAV